jgi:hypothetical protein
VSAVARAELEALYPWSAVAKGRARQRQRVSLMEDYLFIGGDQMTARIAAERLGVCPRTVQRYRAVLRNLSGRAAA